MAKESSAVDTANPEALIAYLDDGPLPAYPRMAHERHVDEMMRGYRDMAYALVALALQEDSPADIRANPVLTWWVDEVLGLDIKVLLAGLRRRKGKVRFPRIRETTYDSNDEGDDDDTE